MPNSEHSSHPINDEEPDDFHKEFDIWLGLQYKIVAGEYEFSYKYIRESNRERVELEELFRNAPWSSFYRQRDFEEELTRAIEIRGDTVVQADAEGGDIFWSKKNDAIMTLHSRKSLYGELRYWNPETEKWQRRVTHSRPYCWRIVFKAKHNRNGSPNEKHKFSYNVRLKNDSHHMEEHEIDPDIQNPKV